MALTQRIFDNLRGDRSIWLVAFMLSMASILAVYSSTGSLAYKYQQGNTEFYILKHVLLLVASWFVLYICYLLHYTRYARLAPWMLVIAVFLLILTLAIGTDINDARRWIKLPGINQSFQASDFAKIALIVYLAVQITRKQDIIKSFQAAFLPLFLPVVGICFLIAPANLSTALVLFLVCILMMFIGRVPLKFIGALLVLGVAAFAMLVIIDRVAPGLVRLDTWIVRVQDFMGNSEGKYQVEQSKIAIAKGGFFGMGPGNSMQRNFLPHPYSDFIFSIIIEEYGLLGAALVLGLYLLLLFRCVRLVTIAPKAFGAIVAIGLCLMLVIQALANMAVSVHLVPVTGLPLPMVSMGGNSVLFTGASIGIILSVSKYIESARERSDI